MEPTRSFRVVAYAFIGAMASFFVAVIATLLDSLLVRLVAVAGMLISIGVAVYGLLLLFLPDKSD